MLCRGFVHPRPKKPCQGQSPPKPGLVGCRDNLCLFQASVASQGGLNCSRKRSVSVPGCSQWTVTRWPGLNPARSSHFPVSRIFGTVFFRQKSPVCSICKLRMFISVLHFFRAIDSMMLDQLLARTRRGHSKWRIGSPLFRADRPHTTTPAAPNRAGWVFVTSSLTMEMDLPGCRGCREVEIGGNHRPGMAGVAGLPLFRRRG